MSHPYDLLDIPGLPGKLIFTPCPGTRDTPLDEALRALKQAGAAAVITLMPQAELAANGAEHIARHCEALGLAWYHLPVADEQVPQEDFGQGWKASRQAILDQLVLDPRWLVLIDPNAPNAERSAETAPPEQDRANIATPP